MTTPVKRIISSRVGQTTFDNSVFTSEKKVKGLTLAKFVRLDIAINSNKPLLTCKDGEGYNSLPL